MQIRFLKRTESDVPAHPFVYGQVIAIDAMTAQARDWLESGAAEVVRDETTEDVATVEDAERAVVGRRRKG